MLLKYDERAYVPNKWDNANTTKGANKATSYNGTYTIVRMVQWMSIALRTRDSL